MNWYDDLCEYYSVTPEQALQLGTRSSGRKPDLPGSETCEPVSGMTFEDIWALKPRDTNEQIFEFYRDQGAWSTFRQCVRHVDLIGLHLNVFKIVAQYFSQTRGSLANIHFLEYGCGVAPFINTLLSTIQGDPELILSLIHI